MVDANSKTLSVTFDESAEDSVWAQALGALRTQYPISFRMTTPEGGYVYVLGRVVALTYVEGSGVQCLIHVMESSTDSLAAITKGYYPC